MHGVSLYVSPRLSIASRWYRERGTLAAAQLLKSLLQHYFLQGSQYSQTQSANTHRPEPKSEKVQVQTKCARLFTRSHLTPYDQVRAQHAGAALVQSVQPLGPEQLTLPVRLSLYSLH